MLSTPALSRYIELCMFKPFLRFYVKTVFDGMLYSTTNGFQPFLRFYLVYTADVGAGAMSVQFQPFLRFYPYSYDVFNGFVIDMFQPFLRFYSVVKIDEAGIVQHGVFQPFLRFYYCISRLAIGDAVQQVSTLLEILRASRAAG